MKSNDVSLSCNKREAKWLAKLDSASIVSEIKDAKKLPENI